MNDTIAKRDPTARVGTPDRPVLGEWRWVLIKDDTKKRSESGQ